MPSLRRSATIISLVSVVAAALVGGSGVSMAGSQPGDGSGGKAVSHRSEGRRTPAKNAPDARLYQVGAQAIEPTLGITRNGDIFYTAASGVSSIDIYKSTDDGKSWKVASPTLAGQKTHRVTLDPYIYVDESTGRIFDIDLTVACSYLSFSDDGGESWVTNPLACGRPINDHQTLFGGPPSISPTAPTYEEVVYYCWNDFGSGTSCSKSLDGGVSWVVTGTRPFEGVDTESQSGNLCGGFNGHGVVGEDGTVYLPKEYCGQPWLGISHDEGATWERVQVANNTTEFLGSDTSVAVDKKGNLYYTYETANQMLYLVTSKDGGKTWSRPRMVGSPGVNEVTLPTLDVGDPGKVAIAYMGSTNSPFRKCKDNCSGADYRDTTWNGYITMTTNALAKDPVFFSGSVNKPSDPFYRGKCDFSNRCRPVLDFIDIEISPNGYPYGAFIDACVGICATEAGPINGGAAVVGSLIGGPKLR